MASTQTVTCPKCGKNWDIPGARIKPKIHCSCGAVFKPHGASSSPTLGPRPTYPAMQLVSLVFGALGVIAVVAAIGVAVYTIVTGASENEWEVAWRCGMPMAFGMILLAISQLFRIIMDMAAFLWEISNTLRQIKLTGAGGTSGRPEPPGGKPLAPAPPRL
jgi:uncharacterized membrane protein